MNILREIKLNFLKMRLPRKMLIIYILVVLIPTVALAGIFFASNVRTTQEMYKQSQAYAISTSREMLDIQINQLEQAFQLFQNSNTLAHLLVNDAPNISSTMFYYFRDVRTLMNMNMAIPHVLNIRLIGTGDMLLNMDNGITSAKHLTKADEFIMDIDTVDAFWVVDWSNNEPLLKYYRSLYSSNFLFKQGVAEFTLDFNSIITPPLNNFNSSLLYFVIDDETIIEYKDGTFYPYQEYAQTLRTNQSLSSIKPQQGFPEILIATTTPQTITYQNQFLLLLLIILLIIFTLLYFLLTKTITDRLIAFEIHISQTKTNNLKPFNSEYDDEIGVVINAYNELVSRTNNLIHENLLVTLKKQEADYYALQSQIKPHFLYNILENIRMNAETHRDLETATMLTALGKYMRYSLNMSHTLISLTDELYSAKNYLEIHKIRMKEKIEVEIKVSAETNNVFVPRFLLQPLIENSILHGYHLERKLQISILVTDGGNIGKPELVILELIDNGNGIAKEKLSELQDMLNRRKTEVANHIGLPSVSRRISAIYNDPENSHLFIESPNGRGCKITLLLKKEGNVHENINCRR